MKNVIFGILRGIGLVFLMMGMPAHSQQVSGGSATASLNGLTITATTGTLTLANAKVFTVSNTLTLAGTDGTTLTFPATSATIARTDAAQTFLGVQTFSASAVFSTGIIGAGSPGGTGGTSYGSIAPITIYVKSVTVKTSGTPADIATINLPSGIAARFAIYSNLSDGTINGSCITQETGGNIGAATFEGHGSAGGGGYDIFAGSPGPVTTGVGYLVNNPDLVVEINSTSTIFIRQTTNSLNAGTVSFYITIFPLP